MQLSACRRGCRWNFSGPIARAGAACSPSTACRRCALDRRLCGSRTGGTSGRVEEEFARRSLTSASSTDQRPRPCSPLGRRAVLPNPARRGHNRMRVSLAGAPAPVIHVDDLWGLLPEVVRRHESVASSEATSPASRFVASNAARYFATRLVVRSVKHSTPYPPTPPRHRVALGDVVATAWHGRAESACLTDETLVLRAVRPTSSAFQEDPRRIRTERAWRGGAAAHATKARRSVCGPRLLHGVALGPASRARQVGSSQVTRAASRARPRCADRHEVHWRARTLRPSSLGQGARTFVAIGKAGLQRERPSKPSMVRQARIMSPGRRTRPRRSSRASEQERSAGTGTARAADSSSVFRRSLNVSPSG